MMISANYLILAIAVMLLFGELFHKITKKLHIPDVTGYLFAGLLLGPGLISLIPVFSGYKGVVSYEAIEDLKILVKMELGFIAFGVGCEFKKDYVKRVGKKSILLACFESLSAVIVITCLFMALSPIMTKLLNVDYVTYFSFAIAFGAIGSATAPASTLLVLKQYRAKGIVSSTLTAVVAIDDATALIAFGLAISVIELISGTAGSAGELSLLIAMPFIEIIFAILIGGVIGFLLAIVIRTFKGRSTRVVLVIAGVFLTIGLIEILNDQLSAAWGQNVTISEIFGCMIMGVLFTNLSPDEEQATELLERFTPMMIVMFFVLSGADLRLGQIDSFGALAICVVTYILGMASGKFLGVFAGGKALKCPKKITHLLPMGLLPQGGVALGLVLIVSSIPSLVVLSPELSATVVIACIITELIGPIFTKRMIYKAGEADLTLR